MTLRMKDLQAIEDDLKKRKLSDLDLGSEKPLSIKQAVMKLAPTLLKKRSQGFGTADLVELLSQHQITIKPRDLSRYLNEYKRMNGCNSHPKQMSKSITSKRTRSIVQISAPSNKGENQASLDSDSNRTT